MRRIIFVLLTISVLSIAFLCGCAPIKYVSADAVHNREVADSTKVVAERVRVDSVYVSHVERIEGERVLVHDTLIRYQKIMVRDTVTRVQEVMVLDSVPYPVEVIKEVRVRNAYDKFTARAFWVLILAIVGGVALWIGSKTPQGRAVLSAIKIISKF